MQSNYPFLNDHSYSMPVDSDKLSLKQRQMKNKTRHGTSNRSNKTLKTDHTVSIHRSSSDKENNLSSPIDVSITTRDPPENKNKSSTKKKTTKSRIQTGKKQNNKTLSKSRVKSTQDKTIKKKKSTIKPLLSHSMDTSGVPLALSIEERVKLRRTVPILTPVKPVSITKLPINIQKSVRRIHFSKTKKNIIKPKKFFLGSGLDLDNIVLGNRQRRSVQT